VFCLDEKTAIQALDRLDPVLPLSPDRALLRRMQVETDYVRGFAFKIGIVASHIAFQSVGFQLRLGQNPLHRGFAERQIARQFPAGPVRAAVPWWLLHSPDHAGLHLRRRCPRLAAQMTAFQARTVQKLSCLERECVGAFRGGQPREVCETLIVDHEKGYRGDL
jgi:hypothetical protein